MLRMSLYLSLILKVPRGKNTFKQFSQHTERVRAVQLTVTKLPFFLYRTSRCVDNDYKLYIIQSSNTTFGNAVLDDCIIYNLSSLSTQRNVLYQNYQSQSSYPHLSLQEPQEQNFKTLYQYIFQ